MPNWCNNKLTIEDCSPELEEFLKTEGFSFNKIKPTPAELLENDGWYNWNVNNWGTKWDIGESAEVTGDLIEGGIAFFDTAWSPPIQAIEALSEKFPSVNFILEYIEMGCMFAGRAEISEGESMVDHIEDDKEVNLFAKEVFEWEDEEFEDEE